MRQTSPVVYLLGAGPGDPGLLTVRGQELLRQADCVVYDYLVHPAILALVPARAERLFVGKKGGAQLLSQDEINQLLVDRAASHRVVVRLKGGDPFFFGRGGEEARALHAAGIQAHIIPGVTSGIACPAYAGIPVTDRDSASSVVFLTGHERPGQPSRHNWQALAQVGTMVVYMGVKAMPRIAGQLMEHGKDPETPVVLVRWGTWSHQEILAGNLATIAEDIERSGLRPPAIAVIGDVARNHEQLAWFTPGPLAGKNILVAGVEAGGALAQALGEAGARVLDCPSDILQAPSDNTELDHALQQLGDFTWLAFTSRASVRHTMARLQHLGLDARELAGLRIAAVGPSCADELAKFYLRPDCVPERHDSKHLAAFMAEQAQALTPSVQQTVLHPGSEGRVHPLGSALEAAGFSYRRVSAYRSVTRTGTMRLLDEQLHAICLGSPSSVRRFIGTVGQEQCHALVQQGAQVFVIGAATAKACAEAGITVHAQAAVATVPGLVTCAVDSLPETSDNDSL